MKRPDRRPRRAPIKLAMEPLEIRWLMSAGGKEAQATKLSEVLERIGRSQTTLETFARGLAHSPGRASGLGLAGLASELRQHGAYARQHGWAASLVRELTNHPRYAAAHHLTGLITTTTAGATPVSQPGAGDSSSTSTITASPSGGATTTAGSSTSAGGSTAPTQPQPSTPAPAVPTVPLSRSVSVGDTLDVNLASAAGASGSAYIITPQPLPENMSFNRETGEFLFMPAPGQAGRYDFNISVQGGASPENIHLALTASQPALPSTQVSGRVVDELGQPLAGMPVAIDGATTVTDSAGRFVLAGIATNPGPISAGGSTATAANRLPLISPVAQLLAHSIYADVNNVIASPLILPKIDWSASSSFAADAATGTTDIASSALPGFNIRVPASPGLQAESATGGTVSTAQLSAALSAQHMPDGTQGGTILYKVTGADLTRPVQLTLPNTQGLKPGAVVDLITVNMLTGGHDVTSRMVVSADGKTLSSQGTVVLAHAATTTTAPPPGQLTADSWDPIIGYNTFIGCLGEGNEGPTATAVQQCTCPIGAGGAASPPNSGGTPPAGSPAGKQQAYGVMNSDASLVSGAYFQDHQLVPYQSLGTSQSIDLQYSSLQATSKPVVQAMFTTPPDGNAGGLTSVTATVSLGGVVQGSAVTFPTPSGLLDSTTYNIPLQVDATALATGVYPFVMTITENWGIEFGATSLSFQVAGEVDVVNAMASPLGAGWTVGDVQQVALATAGGPAVVAQGQNGMEHFDYVYNNGQSQYQDLAVVAGTSTAQMLPNNGAGLFPTASVSSATTAGTVAGDFNGDGKPDLAAAAGSTLAIRLNNGTGGFGSATSITLASGKTARALAEGNFTGHTNGVLDLAVLLAPSSGSGSYTVAVYTGSGTGTFTGPTTTTVGSGTASNTSPDSMAAGDFNGDGKTDLAFTSDNGVLVVLQASSGGSFGTATTPTLPSNHSAIGVTTTDYNSDGKVDLVVEVDNWNVTEVGLPFVALDLMAGSGTGSFSNVSTYQTVGQPDSATLGLVAGAFNGSDAGLEIAVPVSTSPTVGDTYIDIVPLSTSGTWGNGIIYAAGQDNGTTPGNIVAADFNGTGRPGIAMSDSYGKLNLLLPDPATNQFYPVQSITIGGGVVMLAVAPFEGTGAVAGFRGPSSNPSTLLHNGNGTWTRTYPDGTVIQFDSSGRETSITDRNGNAYTYGYVSAGAAAGAVQSVADPVGLRTTFAYNGSGRLSTITDPAGRVTTVTMDASGNLTKFVDPDNAATQYGYTTPSNHRMTSETNPNNHTATITYNGFGQLTSETLFDGTSSTGVTGAQTPGLLAPGGSGTLSSSYQGVVTDPDGHATTVTLNWMGHTSSVTDGANTTASTVYDRRGFPVAAVDPLGRRTTYTFDDNGNVTSIYRLVSSSSGGSTYETETIAYNDPYGIPTSITDFNGNTTTFTLDSHGNVTRRTDPDTLHEDFTYNARGQVLTDTDRNGNTTSYSYDSNGRLTTIQYPGSDTPVVKYTYTSAGDLQSVTDANGNRVTYTYDNAGRVLTSQNPIQKAASKTVNFGYDADGNLTGVTDANGHATSYMYDARDRLTTMIDAANQGTGKATVYAYDPAGNLAQVTDPLGHAVTFAYDGDNRMTGTTDGMGDRVTWTYDNAGEVTIYNDGDGHPFTYSYDPLGRLQAEYGPIKTAGSGGGSYSGTQVASYTYDKNGNLIAFRDGNNNVTKYGYDSLNRVVTVTDANNNITSYTYDNNGNVQTVKDANGHATSYAYDARNNQIRVTEPTGGGTTTYQYDPGNRLKSLTDPDNNTTTYLYDSANRVTTVVDPLNHYTTYVYDVMDNLATMVDRNGRIHQYAYDADDRETTEKWIPIGGGTATNTVTYTYDAAGRTTQVQDATSKTALTYDNANRLLTADDAGTTGLPQVTLTYGYDPAGNRTTLVDSKGGLTSYIYDARNELVTMTQSGTGISSKRVDIAYDNGGRMTTITRYSSLTGGTPVATTGYTYDAGDRVTTITDKNSSGTVLASYGYTYDPGDRVTQEARTWASGSSTDTLTYGYTNNDQLTSVSHTNASFANESFSYDANGNRTGTSPTDNRIATDGTYNYTYDNEGNETVRTKISDGSQTIYKYDYRNRLVEVDSKVGTTTTPLATYTYDALDRRIGRTEGGVTTATLYDGASPIMDFTGGLTSPTTRYLQGIGAAVDQDLARDQSGIVAWYLPDRLGTVRDLVDNTGAIIDHVDYGAYGNQLAESTPAYGDRLAGFAGLDRDPATGLNLAVFRASDPKTGRWTNQDPLKFTAGDRNLYRYVGSSPTNFTDPTGLEVFPPPGHNPDGTPKNRPHQMPTDPSGTWTPTQFFGPGSPLIKQTSWGCGGLAALRLGVTPDYPISKYLGKLHPNDILSLPNIQDYPTLQQAKDALHRIGGKGKILLVDSPYPQWWTDGPASCNFSTYWPGPDGGYWEWQNHGDMQPGRVIRHEPNPPDLHPYKTYYLIPTPKVKPL
ncbi:Putative deoxyribonuclease RhsC [Aquisphaera giovannonii]|uniref:Deoxyribonuclease RhsC n=1 Tax=Aquisphaera giovannonii TaxID=406548 RepID=A0A5B9VW38_9BACT|nr:FG-GAP-like repeat-containing protein [Aquisphaera giovannonii]QEH32071.1 Putative deoxyribonuclease RhsC [Aquisphaera giovannonii]